MRAKLVASYAYRNFRYSSNHPLRIPRVSLLLDFLKAMELVKDTEVDEGRNATQEELLEYHTEDYINALREADACGCVKPKYRELYNIGTYENPLSPATWRGSLLACGSSLKAAELFLEGHISFNPAGGMHHAYPSRANGFCFINDPAVTIQMLKKLGFKKILYIDLDAHHCDAVQDFYYHDDSVFVFSIHQSPEYAFPFTKGFLHERGASKGKGFNLNAPLPKGVTDTEFLKVLETGIEVIKEVFKPDVYLLQLGTDGLEEDYLSKWRLSNWGFLKAFKMVREAFGDGIYLGGGGYHPIALTRAWSLVWCEISGREVPTTLRREAREVLLSVGWEELDETDRSYMYETLLDKPREGHIRREILSICEAMKSHLFV
ncbi:Histone deacetylase [Thermocrinis albus DSM 14484]|uniref:Histone deacetylase n=1 Tax=Thermocrinis albus (strain DSM 14484 / JCM 11386 / HI 11/12) TaxID=638303 RepID=D3SN19_THEAH|nr:acetoin utilization protein [Thermocrinis albus]ADC90149.1 Histone deacetylase [Thermocrinis albus DSM 14484]